jgi:diadenosine tetraphosphatase ApaH/serine/threonine PP2A family protein phosphatase
VISLGDFVGYGAEPNQVLDLMRTLRATKHYIRGNHDRVASGIDDGSSFNHAARSAALWTRDHLSAVNQRFVLDLTVGPLQHEDLMLCHGSPYDEDEYLFTEHHAALVFKLFASRVIFYGHTHLPVFFSVDERGRIDGEWIRGDAALHLDPARRYLINPGSVGQPRDRNPRASFAFYDSGRRRVKFYRVDYDVSATQRSILSAGLPKILAERLAVGT